MEGFRSLKEGVPVDFTYKKSCKGLESLRVTGPGGGPCAGSERRPKGKVPLQKRKPKGDRSVNNASVAEKVSNCGNVVEVKITLMAPFYRIFRTIRRTEKSCIFLKAHSAL